MAFPNRDAVPSHVGQFRLLFFVALLVPLYFLFPKILVRLGQVAVFAPLVAVPEATVDEDDRSVFEHHYVGMSGQAGVVQAVTESPAEEKMPHNHLRLRPPALDCCHAAVALLFA